MSVATRRNRPESTNRLYQTSRWKRESLLFKRIHIWCVMCKEHGIDTIGTVTDHKVAHKSNETLFWD
jgi:hypothetical protein